MLGGLDKWVGGFIGLGIFASVGAVVVAAVRDTQTSGTTAYNASDAALSGIGNLTTQFGSAGTIAGIAAIVLAAVLILGYFGFGGRNR